MVTNVFSFVSLLLFFLLLNQAYGANEPVIIVGAGMAGAKLAFEFHNAGIPYLLLEATDRVGGRLRQGRIARNTPILELGGNWLQGYRPNDKFSNLVRNVIKIKMIPDNLESYYLYDNGRRIPDEEADPVWERFENALVKVYNLTRTYARGPNNETRNEISVEDALLLAAGWQARTPIELGVQEGEIDYEYAHRASLVSVHELSEYRDPEEPPTSQFFIKDNGGFRRVVNWHLYRAGIQNIYKSGPRLKLRTPVRKIFYSNHGAHVELWNGRKIYGSAVVSTVSLGVLQYSMERGNPFIRAKQLLFEPPLPFEKRVAISKQSMGTYIKMFVKFNRPLFKSTDPLYIRPLSCRENYFVSIQNFNRPLYFPGQNIVLYTATGSLGRELQCVSREQRIMEALEAMSRAVGRKVMRWEVHSVLVSPFLENQYFRGMYSGRGMGMSDEDIRNFNKRVGSLFFAGEAHYRNQGYVQSAYYSAEKTAKEVMMYLSKSAGK